MNGELEGEGMTWNEDGEIYSRELWRNGEMIDCDFTLTKRRHLLRFKTEIVSLLDNEKRNSLNQFLIGNPINAFCKHTCITFENVAIRTMKLSRILSRRSTVRR